VLNFLQIIIQGNVTAAISKQQLLVFSNSD